MSFKHVVYPVIYPVGTGLPNGITAESAEKSMDVLKSLGYTLRFSTPLEANGIAAVVYTFEKIDS